MAFIFLAFAAGALTILAPCILPLLPVILGGTQGSSPWRPVAVVMGFIATFSAVGATLATAGSFIGIMPDTLRIVAVVLLALMGVLLLFPQLYAAVQVPLERVLSGKGQQLAQAGSRKGLGGGLLIGVAMGLIWTPCAGPILGSILTLAATTKDALSTLFLLGAYALGAALPMLAIAYAGRKLVAWLSARAQAVSIMNKVFGALLIVAAVAIGTGYDRVIQEALLPYLPSFILL